MILRSFDDTLCNRESNGVSNTIFWASRAVVFWSRLSCADYWSDQISWQIGSKSCSRRPSLHCFGSLFSLLCSFIKQRKEHCGKDVWYKTTPSRVRILWSALIFFPCTHLSYTGNWSYRGFFCYLIKHRSGIRGRSFLIKGRLYSPSEARGGL